MAITVNSDGTEERGLIDDNVIQPFRLEKTAIRGRVVRLGSVLKEIVGKHDYPPPVSRLLSEALTICLLLSSMLKYEGIFSLQVKGDGPINTIMADVTSQGHVRGYANYDADAIKVAAKRMIDKEEANFFPLLGKGYMAFTVDHAGEKDHRYQGIVELSGDNLIDCIQGYFNQSEQIETFVKMAIHPQDFQCRSGGIMIQRMPEEPEMLEEDADEHWNRTKILLETCSEDELLSPNLHSADILYRLFHEEGVRVYSPTPVRHVCRCSRDKVENILKTLSLEELNEHKEEEGSLVMRCELCGEEYKFNKDELDEALTKE